MSDPKKENQPEPPKEDAGGFDGDDQESYSNMVLDARPKRHRWRDIFWNPDEGTCLLRTPNSWMKVGIFYLIFFSFVGAVLYCGLAIFYSIIQDNMDTGPINVFMDYPNIHQVSPGIAPRLKNINSVPRVVLAKVNVTKDNLRGILDPIVAIINKSIEANEDDSKSYDWGPCTLSLNETESGKPIDLNAYLDSIDNHSNAKTFGYGGEYPEPCVLIQLSKIYSWEPAKGEGFKDTTSYEERKVYIKPSLEGFEEATGEKPDGSHIPFYCFKDLKEEKGERVEDTGNNLTFKYYPLVDGKFKGFPMDKFPIKPNDRKKQSPFVFVQVGVSNRNYYTPGITEEEDVVSGVGKNIPMVRCFFLNDKLDINEKTTETDMGIGSIKFGVVVVEEKK